jgi:thermostable 8-oxoguanine DNA glycosylase
MFVKQTAHSWKIAFDRAELARWKTLVIRFGPFVEMPKPRRSNRELWDQFVQEFMIRGGTRLIDRMQKNRRDIFLRETSLRALANAASPVGQLRRALRGTTRFWRKAAKSIEKCRKDNKVVRGGRFVLLKDLSRLSSDVELRDEILRRCRTLGLKGTSDFLISIGAAQDLAAIDTRILRCLEKHFGASPEIRSARSSRPLYLALESALREVAEKNEIPLSKLDRIIFQASGKSALDFCLEANEVQKMSV